MTCKHKSLDSLDIKKLPVNQIVACSNCWKEFKVQHSSYKKEKILIPKSIAPKR